MPDDGAQLRAESVSGLRELLSAADSLLSLCEHRPDSPHDPEVRADLHRVSIECRKAVGGLADADALAVKVAEAVWPGKYAGDLTEKQWDRCYAVLAALLGGGK